MGSNMTSPSFLLRLSGDRRSSAPAISSATMSTSATLFHTCVRYMHVQDRFLPIPFFSLYHRLKSMVTMPSERSAGLDWKLSMATFSRTRLIQVCTCTSTCQYYHELPHVLSQTFSFPAHRALPDVEALVKLFTQMALDLLSSVPTRPARQQLLLWRTQKEERSRTCSLLQALGKRVTVSQAKHLDTLHLTYPVLRQIRSSCTSSDKFQKVLWQR